MTGLSLMSAPENEATLIILPRIKICGKEIFPLIARHPIMLGSGND